MLNLRRYTANSLISLSITSLLWATCQDREANNSQVLTGGCGYIQNIQNQSISWYSELSNVQDLSSATGTVAIAMLNYQDFSSSNPGLSLSASLPTAE